MSCQNINAVNSYQDQMSTSETVSDFWEYAFESEIKYMKKYASNGMVSVFDIKDMQECIESLKQESSNFEYRGRAYDLSENIDELLLNL